VTYVKIHDLILRSSIMEEDVTVRWVWVVILAMADQDGLVQSTPNALARTANLPQKDIDRALKILMSPDKNSTSQEEEGKRLVVHSPNVFRVVNYEHYRHLMSAEDKKEKTRIRVARHRAKKKNEQDGNADVTRCNAGNDKADTDTETDTDTEAEVNIPFDEFWNLVTRKIAKEPARLIWVGTKPLITKKKMTDADRDAAMKAFPYHAAMWKAERRTADKIPHPRTWLYQCRWLDEITGRPRIESGVWIVDTYRVVDRDRFGNHSRWDEYVDDATRYPPNTAPTFEDWLKEKG
jgi:hypothetical protein